MPAAPSQGVRPLRLAALLLSAAAVLAAPAALAQTAAAPPPLPPAAPWASPLAQDHPLVGSFWSTTTGERLTPAQVVDRALDSRVVIVGERHDNPDHHALQAWLTQAVVGGGRRPAVVYEMMETDDQPAIDAWRAGGPADAAGLGDALDWAKTGWPDWPLYAPMAGTALAHGLPILAGNLPQDTVRRLAREGLPAVEAGLAADLALAEEDTPAVRDGLADDVRRGHCDLMPEAMLAPMALVQRARDAMMARVVAQGLADPAADAALLVTGNGHAREDRGVPLRLAALGIPPEHVLTVAPVEVEDGMVDPAAYLTAREGAAAPAFDIVWFSPRVDDVDHCAALRERMKNKKK